MLARRELIIGAMAAAVSIRPAVAHDKRDRIDPIYLPQIVQFARGYKPGDLYERVAIGTPVHVTG